MAMSKSAERAYKKAVKAKKKAKRGHWLLIQKGDSVKEVFSKLFTQFAVLVLIGCGVILANEFRLSFSARQLNDSLKSLYQSYIAHDSGGDVLPGAAQLLKINPDTVGYISIDGTEVDFPVVQTTDNSTYLKKHSTAAATRQARYFLITVTCSHQIKGRTILSFTVTIRKTVQCSAA